MPDGKRYWFPAKRFGWGWGLPITWEGWVVMAVYIGLIVGITVVVPPARSISGFAISVAAATIIFMLACWWKGEPPKWRWGDE
jgi:hypothetical protein